MNRYLRTSLLWTAAFTAVLPFVGPQEAQAIPAFSRANKTECVTCHTIFPELTEQGENFMKNSFSWIATKGEDTEAKKPVKDEAKNDDKEYLLLSSIPEYVPFSLSGTFLGSYNEMASAGNKGDLATQAITLQAGGTFNDKLGVYGKYYLYRQNNADVDMLNAPTNLLPDLREFFVSVRHVFDSPVNIKIGRQIPELSLWKGWNKIGTSDMATSSYRVSKSPYFVDASVDAVELNAIVKGKVFVAAGAAKRKNSNNLEGFGSISYKYGGTDFEGGEAPLNLEEDSFLDYLSLTLNGYVYGGSTQQVSNVTGLKEVNDFYRYGVESDLRYLRLRLKLAGAFGQDKDPDFAGPAARTKIKSSVFAGEASYQIRPRLIGSFRYEYENTDTIIDRYIPIIAYAPLQNAKMVLEYKREEVKDGRKNNVVSLGGTVSF